MRELSVVMILTCALWLLHDGVHAKEKSDAVASASNTKEGRHAVEVPKRVQDFTKGLSPCKIAIVKVEGMVCDFCARGIEKSFNKDKAYKKIKIDLDLGEVMIAYAASKDIQFEIIKDHFKKNGQTATRLDVVEIR